MQKFFFSLIFLVTAIGCTATPEEACENIASCGVKADDCLAGVNKLRLKSEEKGCESEFDALLDCLASSDCDELQKRAACDLEDNELDACRGVGEL